MKNTSKFSSQIGFNVFFFTFVCPIFPYEEISISIETPFSKYGNIRTLIPPRERTTNGSDVPFLSITARSEACVCVCVCVVCVCVWEREKEGVCVCVKAMCESEV